MKRRKLGRGDLEVAAVGLGCMGMSQSYPSFPGKKELIGFIQRAVDMGQNFLDTSGTYGVYANEELIGEALENCRDNVVIASEFGWDIRNGRVWGRDSRPGTIRKAVEGSLRRLRTDRIDLYYHHRVDPDVSIEEVAGTIKELKQEGKILYWGLSEADIATIRRANAVHPVTAVQGEYSLWYREPEKELLPVLEELGIGFVSSCPLGNGFLTGTISTNTAFVENDVHQRISRFYDQKNLTASQFLVKVIKKFAEENELSPAQVALAWLLHEKEWIVPIPGTKNKGHLQENMSAAYVKLPEKSWQILHKLLYEYPVFGEENAQGMGDFKREKRLL